MHGFWGEYLSKDVWPPFPSQARTKILCCEGKAVLTGAGAKTSRWLIGW